MWQIVQSKVANTLKANKKIWLLLPFALFALILFVIPLAIILVYAFRPVVENGAAGTVADNFGIVDGFVWEKIWKSLWISVVSTAIVLFVAFPFCYFLAFARNKVYKAAIILFATAPIWSSFLVKLVGLKSLFDLLATAAAGTLTVNSTYGDGYTVVGMCYIYIPFMILPLYSVLTAMPRNYVLASQDLGYGTFKTFFKIVIPYCKTAIFSGISLVLLPAFTTVAIPQFLNNSNDASLIGDYIFSLGSNALESNVAIAQASALSLVLASLILAFYAAWKLAPKLFWLIKGKIARAKAAAARG